MERQQQIDTDNLSSDRNIDYTQLRNLLKAGKWKEANDKTARQMCEVMGRQEEGWLRVEDIEQFPCTDLRTLDQLWVKYSKGKFGFSVQKQIWQAFGSPRAVIDADWEKFCDRVGWRVKDEYIAYTQLNFDTSAPKAHLPTLCAVYAGFPWVALVGWEDLFSLAKTCKL